MMQIQPLQTLRYPEPESRMEKKMKTGITLNLYAGVENLLDETYSLGNDINAAAGRYYNAAAGRSFYAGVVFNWKK
ncbi:MAG: TonB-dependent receptor [Chitinophagaceae bacterium]|nr:TonB-dependent receptor [Chitinophagaceae bacterium]